MRPTLLVALTLLLQTSCLPNRASVPFDEDGATSQTSTCGDDRDCAAYVCDDGMCLTGCATNDDCQNSFECADGRCVCGEDRDCDGDAVCQAGVCVEPLRCEDDAPCGGYICEKDTCEMECDPDRKGCADNFGCLNGECQALQACQNDGDCNGYKCDRGLCLVSCKGDRECAREFECSDNRCDED